MSASTIDRSVQKFSAVAGVLLTLVLSGCSSLGQGSSQGEGTQVATVQPTPASSSRGLIAPVRTLDVNVSFRERLMIPPGARLEVVVKSAAGNVQGSVVSATASGMPYRVKVPLTASINGRLTVSAVLTSSAGHVLRGSQQVAASDSGAVDLVVKVSP